MKKIFAGFVLCFMILGFAFAKPVNIKSIVVIPSTENITGPEATYLPGSVKDKLDSNLTSYSGLTVIDNYNEARIKQLQLKSSDKEFNEDDMLEVGKITSASHGLFVTIRKTSSSYSIAVKVSDLTTGRLVASKVSDLRKTPEELFSSRGNAVDEVTIKILDELGIELSAQDRFVLKNGDENLSNDDKAALYKKEREKNQKLIDDYDAQIAILANSSDLDASAKAAKIQADRAVAERKLKIAQDNEKRLQEALEQEREAKALAESRSAEENNKLREVSALANEKLAELTNMKLNDETTLGLISVIESKKKALVEIRSKVEEEKELARSDAQAEKKKLRAKAFNREFEDWETDEEGYLLPEIRREIEDDLTKQESKIDDIMYENFRDLDKSITEQERALLDEINDNYGLLRNRTISTVGDKAELSVSFRKYHGGDKLWNVNVYFISDGAILFQDTTQITYEQIFGKAPDRHDPEYGSNVNLYNGLFLMGEPVLTFEMDYDVIPADKNTPSKYDFSIKELRFYKTSDMTVGKNGKVASGKATILPLSHRYVSHQMTPAWDIRSVGEIRQDKIEKQEAHEAKVAQEQKREKYKWAYQEEGQGSRSFMAMGYGNYLTGPIQGGLFTMDMSFGFTPYVYSVLGMGFGFNSKIPDLQKYTNLPSSDLFSMILLFYWDVGFNKRLHLGSFHPNLYISGGIGFKLGLISEDTGSSTTDGYGSSDSYYSSSSSYSDTSSSTGADIDGPGFFIPRICVGVDIPMGEMFALNVGCDFDYNAQDKDPFGAMLRVGLFLTMPFLSF